MSLLTLFEHGTSLMASLKSVRTCIEMKSCTTSQTASFYPDKAVFTYVEATVADQEAVLEQMKKGVVTLPEKGEYEVGYE